MRAVDFPCDPRGAAAEEQVPQLYREWGRFAWGDLLPSLPFDDYEFLCAVERLLATPVPIALPNYGSSRVLALVDGAYRLARHKAEEERRPVWVTVEPYLLRARVKNGRLWLAVKPGAAGQLLRPVSEIASLSPSEFTRRCVQARIGLRLKNVENNNSLGGKMIDWTILRPTFLQKLGLFDAGGRRNKSQTAENPGFLTGDPVVDLDAKA